MPAFVLFSEIAETASRGDADALEILVAEDPTVVLQKDKRGKTALYYASGATAPQATRCVELLLENKAQPNAAARNGKTPLHCCCEVGNVATLRALVEAGGVINVQDRGKFTPLHSASRCGNLAAVKCLLQASCQVNPQSSSGWSPLHFAAKNNDMRMAMSLVRFDADLNTKNEDGHTPISIAQINGHTKLVNFLAPKAQDEREVFATDSEINGVSFGDLVHHRQPESVAKKLSVLQHLHDISVPSASRKRGPLDRRALQLLSTPEVSGLLAARNLAFLSSPFRAANIDGEALLALDRDEFENLYDSIAVAYLRVNGLELTKTAFMSMVWPQLRAVIQTIVELEGVEEAEIARGLATQSLQDTESIEDTFRALDLDESDSLSIAELVPACQQLEHFRGLSTADIQRLFRTSLHAVNGKLSLEGFKALYNELLQQHVGECTLHAAGNVDITDADGNTDEEDLQVTAQTGEVAPKRRSQPLLHRDGSFGSLMDVQGHIADSTSRAVGNGDRSGIRSTVACRNSGKRDMQHAADTSAVANTARHLQEFEASLRRVGDGDFTTFPALTTASRSDGSRGSQSGGLHGSRRVVKVQSRPQCHRRTNSDQGPARRATCRVAKKKRGTSRGAKKQVV